MVGILNGAVAVELETQRQVLAVRVVVALCMVAVQVVVVEAYQPQISQAMAALAVEIIDI